MAIFDFLNKPQPGSPGAMPDRTPPAQTKEPESKTTDSDPEPKKDSQSSPLDIFSKVFDTAQTDPNSKDKKDDAPLSVDTILNQESLNDVLGKMNLTSFISQETREKLSENPTSEDLLAAINDVGKGAYQSALLHSAKVMETVLDSKLNGLSKNIDSHVQDSLVKNSISVDKAAQSSPVVRASLGMIAEKLRATYPDAPPEWITEQSKQWFTELGKVFAGDQPSDQDKQQQSPARRPGTEDIDWLDFAAGDLKNG